MPVDINKITEMRKPERDRLAPEQRRLHALEQIADALEAIRQEFVLYSSMMSRKP